MSLHEIWPDSEAWLSAAMVLQMALNESAAAGPTRLQWSAIIDHLNRISEETRERERVVLTTTETPEVVAPVPATITVETARAYLQEKKTFWEIEDDENVTWPADLVIEQVQALIENGDHFSLYPVQLTQAKFDRLLLSTEDESYDDESYRKRLAHIKAMERLVEHGDLDAERAQMPSLWEEVDHA